MGVGGHDWGIGLCSLRTLLLVGGECTHLFVTFLMRVTACKLPMPPCLGFICPMCCRAKAGGKQSSQDATGKIAKSAGSALRRYNEQALDRDIQELLLSWRAHLDAADRVREATCIKHTAGAPERSFVAWAWVRTTAEQP